MKILKANFALAKTVKTFAEEGTSFYALHVTGEHTEITDGHFVVRMAHSEQNEFEYIPDSPLDVCFHPDDAINIASSLGKKDSITAILPSDDGKTVQVKFSSGEIRILAKYHHQFPNVQAVQPQDKVGFSLVVNAELLIPILQAFSAKGTPVLLMEFRGSDRVITFRPAASLSPSHPEVSAMLAPARASEIVDLPSVKKTGKRAPAEQDSSDLLNVQ